MTIGSVIAAATPLSSIKLHDAKSNKVIFAATPLYSVVVKDHEV